MKTKGNICTQQEKVLSSALIHPLPDNWKYYLDKSGNNLFYNKKLDIKTEINPNYEIFKDKYIHLKSKNEIPNSKSKTKLNNILNSSRNNGNIFYSRDKSDNTLSNKRQDDNILLEKDFIDLSPLNKDSSYVNIKPKITDININNDPVQFVKSPDKSKLVKDKKHLTLNTNIKNNKIPSLKSKKFISSYNNFGEVMNSKVKTSMIGNIEKIKEKDNLKLRKNLEKYTITKVDSEKINNHTNKNIKKIKLNNIENLTKRSNKLIQNNNTNYLKIENHESSINNKSQQTLKSNIRNIKNKSKLLLDLLNNVKDISQSIDNNFFKSKLKRNMFKNIKKSTNKYSEIKDDINIIRESILNLNNNVSSCKNITSNKAIDKYKSNWKEVINQEYINLNSV